MRVVDIGASISDNGYDLIGPQNRQVAADRAQTTVGMPPCAVICSPIEACIDRKQGRATGGQRERGDAIPRAIIGEARVKTTLCHLGLVWQRGDLTM